MRVSFRSSQRLLVHTSSGREVLEQDLGPPFDRIDLHVEVPAVPFTQLAEMPPGPHL